MTGIDPERLDRRLRWAAEQLGLSPQASPDEVRAAWLRRLPAEDFVPSSELRWALAALLRRQSQEGWETRADEAAFVAEEERLRGEVEAFAEKFWELPTEDRRRRWQELVGRCAFAPALWTRLQLLEPGLAIDSREPSGDKRVIELAGHIRELFVLRPGPRSRARQDILRRIKDDKETKAAARFLRHTCPAFAALGNDLLDKLLAEVWQMVSSQYADNRPRRVRRPAAAKTESQTLFRIWWIVVVIAVPLLRRLACDDGQSSTRHEPPPQFPYKSFQRRENENIPPHGLDLLDEKMREQLEKILNAQKKEWGREEQKHNGVKKDGKNP